MGSGQHSHATEALIVISQTFFLVFLFVFLKKTLIDNRGMMTNRKKVRENAPLLVVIFFAILALLGILLIPLRHYKYAELVMLFTLFAIVAIVTHDLKRVFGPASEGLSTSTSTPPLTTSSSPTTPPKVSTTSKPEPKPRFVIVDEDEEDVGPRYVAEPKIKRKKSETSLFSNIVRSTTSFGKSKQHLSTNKHVCRPANGLEF